MNKSENKEWIDNGFFNIPYEVMKKYAKLTLPELIERLGKSVSFRDMTPEKYIEASIENEEDEEYLPQYIFNYFFNDIAMNIQDRVYQRRIKQLEDKLNDLASRFEDHRHCLEKTYGEKPVW